jgi:hypothetical protein
MDVIDEEDRDANEAPKETVIDLGDYYYNDNDDKVEITKVDLPRAQVNGLRQRSSASMGNGKRASIALSPRQLYQEGKADTQIDVDDDYIRRMTVRTVFRNRLV